MPSYIRDMVKFSEGNYNLRQPRKIEVSGKFAKVETMFSWRLKCLFDDLPVSLWESLNVDSFKTQLSKLILIWHCYRT